MDHDLSAVRAERDQLRRRVAELEAQLGEFLGVEAELRRLDGAGATDA